MVLRRSKHRYGGAASVLGRMWDSVVVLRRLGLRVHRRGTHCGDIGDSGSTRRCELGEGANVFLTRWLHAETAVTVLMEIKKNIL